MPDVIAGFEVHATASLGTGSYGVVCEAKNLETGELVAAKQVRIKSNRSDLPQIVQEIENMKSVSHPNLVRYLDHKQDDRGSVWVFVELCDLGDLDEYFVNTNPNRQEYLQLMQQMANGIVYLHENRVVHRDIKPGNILIKSGVQGGLPIVKIGDFGLAKMIDLRNSTSMLTFSTVNIGTKLYMAPELLVVSFGIQVRGDQSVDIFALGITFFSIICFRQGGKQLIPAEDQKSCPEVGYGYLMNTSGKEKAQSYHKEIVPVKGDEVEQKIRELIQEMIQFDSKKRAEAQVVLSSINEIITILQTGHLKLDETDVPMNAGISFEKEADNAGIEQASSTTVDSAFSGSQKSSDTPVERTTDNPEMTIESVPQDIPDCETIEAPISPGSSATPDSALQVLKNDSQKSNKTDTSEATTDSAGIVSIDSGSMDSRKSSETYTLNVPASPATPGADVSGDESVEETVVEKGASTFGAAKESMGSSEPYIPFIADPSVLESKLSDSQIFQELNVKSLAVFKMKYAVEAVRSDSHKLLCAATEIEKLRDANKLTLKLWDITNHQSWEAYDIVVNHDLNLKNSPESAGVIAILNDRLLLRVRLDDDWRQLLSVDSTNGEVLHKTPVYPGRGVPGYCCYKNQILLPDWKSSSSITQLDAMTLEELNTWKHPEVVEPGSVCSSKNKIAVSYEEDKLISVFKWEEVFISHEMIYTVKFHCKGIHLLRDDTLMACNWDRRWSVWNGNGDQVHYNVKHPHLVQGMKVYPRAIQDPVSGEWFVQERVRVHKDWCRVIYNARIVINRLETGDEKLVDHSLLELNKTMSYK